MALRQGRGGLQGHQRARPRCTGDRVSGPVAGPRVRSQGGERAARRRRGARAPPRQLAAEAPARDRGAVRVLARGRRQRAAVPAGADLIKTLPDPFLPLTS